MFANSAIFFMVGRCKGYYSDGFFSCDIAMGLLFITISYKWFLGNTIFAMLR